MESYRTTIGTKNDQVQVGIQGQSQTRRSSFSQRHGIDYDETFSPVATKATIRILIGLKAQGWHLRHVDEDTAYLNADIDAELYISQPKGFEKRGDQGEVLVCKLRRFTG